MKRLLTITALVLITMTTGVASAATLKPLAAEDAWDSMPIFSTSPPSDSRLFVVERGDSSSHVAKIRIFDDGELRPTPFLAIDNVDVSVERGLLSMAFAPDYATSGLFYVFQVANGPDALDPAGAKGDIRIVEYKRSASDPDLADPASARLVLKTAHSAGNHNGGWMAFGPDGLLYFTIGDNANQANAQVPENLFGKVLRIDPVGTGDGDYRIPADNPLVGNPGARGEIYTWGLRNPFRASFAPNGTLVIGDVGAGQTEEVDLVSGAGKNMGWPVCEGFCDSPHPEFTEPFFTYEHDYSSNPAPGTGNVIIGGYVIRDPDLAGLSGRYIFGDSSRSDLRTLNLGVPGGDPVDPALTIPEGEALLSFGDDSRGCNYVITQKNVYRIAANAAATTGCSHVIRPPDPPDPPVDSTSPELKLSGMRQKLRRKIAISATCSEECSISVKGSVKAKRRGKKKAIGFKYTATSSDAAANKTVKVVLKLKWKALKKARRVLRSGRKLRATFRAVAFDPSGNRGSDKVRLKIKRAKKKR